MKRLLKASTVIVVLTALSACEVLDRAQQTVVPVEDANKTYLCESTDTLDRFGKFCALDAWSEYLLAASEQKWAARQEMIKAMDDAPQQMLEKVLLSQSVDTPYANRLRAQNWLKDLGPQMDTKMQEVANVLIGKTSQQLLELESAITILSRVNTRQEKTITDLQETLNVRQVEMEKQRDQVEQLLEIEANMSDDKRSK